MKKIVVLLICLLSLTGIQAQGFDAVNTTNDDQASSLVNVVTVGNSEAAAREKVAEARIEEEKVEELEKEIIEYDRKLSIIEKNFSLDSGKTLKQFGYSYLLSDSLDNSVASNSNYILGVGDSLKAYIWGDPVDILELKGQYQIEVDENGSFYFPAIGLVHVVGKSVLEVQDIIIAGLKEKYRHFSLELVVTEFKTFTISVSGMVNKPGQVRCTGLSSIIDVLGRVKGVNKQGSLRNITVNRGDETFTFDLYDILISGNGDLNSFLIKEGDSVYVNPIGSVATVQGSVKRPGIYELKDSETVQDLYDYAGGGLVSTLSRDFIVYDLDKHTGNLIPVDSGEGSIFEYTVSDGSVIDVPTVSIEYQDSVFVSGAIRNSGRFGLKDNSTLVSLLKNIQFKPETNVFYGELVRHEVGSREEYFTFIPSWVLKGTQNISLKPGDRIRFRSYGQNTGINKEHFRDVVTLRGVSDGNMTISWAKGLELDHVITEEFLPVDVNMEYASIIRRSEDGSGKDIITFSPRDIISKQVNLTLNRLDEVVFLPKWEYKPVFMSGEIKESNVLTFYPGITLMDAFRGSEFNFPLEELRARVLQNGRVSHIYLYDLLALGDPKSDLELEPGASILVQKLTERENRSQIKLLGNVNKPGIINFTEKMTLYDLLVSGNGLRDDAFLKGLVLFRKSAEVSQREQLEVSLNSMASQLNTLKLEAQNSSLSPEAKASVSAQAAIKESLLKLARERAEKALGRIALDLPDTLEDLKDSSANIALEEGDYIFVPKKPDYVLVLGNVYNQISIRFNSDSTVDDYLNRVGGFKKDSGKAYIVHINGEISSNETRGLFEKRIKDRKLSPGDVVVVPQDLKVPAHITFFDTFSKITGVLADVTTSIFSTYGMLNILGVFK